MDPRNERVRSSVALIYNLPGSGAKHMRWALAYGRIHSGTPGSFFYEEELELALSHSTESSLGYYATRLERDISQPLT